ncbi:biotin--[acetyl-CoA-carboxylase] ligase [bacterium]|nr:biotin--[acetyl-CoA-carboxylase] ligase [bacterium]
MKIGNKIHRFSSCPSTNNLARKYASQGEPEGTVVIADQQTKGKGTQGREWISPPGKGVYISFILYPPASGLSLLPLVGGLTVREAVFESVGVSVQLKWPNDIMWKRKKLGGILCESSFWGGKLLYVILGIGLNTGHQVQDFPEEVRSAASSLDLITSKEVQVERESIVENLFQSLECWYEVFLKGENSKIVDAFQHHSAIYPGKKVTVAAENEVVSGIYSGINPEGGIILDVGGKQKTFYSGQVHFLGK